MLDKRKMISCGLVVGLAVGCISGALSENDFCLEAHRGLSNRFPENTIVAFEAAGKVSAYQGIETDVQETADGELVLFHDKKLKKRTDADGAVIDYTFDELQKINIDHASNSEEYPNQKIPTVEAYLDVCRMYDKIPYIELKSISEKGMEKLIALLKEDGWEEKCVITTFVKEYIPLFRSKNTSIPIEYMIDKDEKYNVEEVVAFLIGYENMVFRPSAYVVTQEEVEFCNEKGIQVEAYGLKVGDKDTLKYLKKIGVKGVTCNDYDGLK